MQRSRNRSHSLFSIEDPGLTDPNRPAFTLAQANRPRQRAGHSLSINRSQRSLLRQNIGGAPAPRRWASIHLSQPVDASQLTHRPTASRNRASLIRPASASSIKSTPSAFAISLTSPACREILCITVMTSTSGSRGHFTIAVRETLIWINFFKSQLPVRRDGPRLNSCLPSSMISTPR